MQAVKIMQLLLLLALLLSGGNFAEFSKEVKPVLEEYGDERVKSVLKQAEELTEAVSALKELMPAAATAAAGINPKKIFEEADCVQPADGLDGADGSPKTGLPLAPVANIADGDIAYCLSRYFSA